MQDSYVIPYPPPESFTSADFERAVAAYVTNRSGGLEEFTVEHLPKLRGSDGDYEIDVPVSFAFMGMTFKVLIECKKQKRNVERDVVQVLHDRVRSVGAQKGAIFTTAGFQAGAIRYATEHGIALIRILPGKALYETKSLTASPVPPNVELPDFAVERFLASTPDSISVRRYVVHGTQWLEDLLVQADIMS